MYLYVSMHVEDVYIISQSMNMCTSLQVLMLIYDDSMSPQEQRGGGTLEVRFGD